MLGAAEAGQPAARRALPPRRARCGRGAWTGSSSTCCSPSACARELREFRPEAVVAADPFVGAAALAGRTIARRRVPVIVEVHGDWRTFTRLYGARSRQLLASSADRLAAFALRRADATRALSASRRA